MYIKLKNGVVDKYPYSINDLRIDNSNTSFPSEMSDERLAEWEVYPVKTFDSPTITYKQNLVEDTPILVNGEWKQVWNVINKSQEEIDALEKSFRAEAYREESDPIFFKWQRGEATEQDWLDKVAEIKARY
jgi:hypothetical protein